MSTQSALLELDSALDEVVASAAPLMACERIQLLEADGRILREDITSEISVPPFDNSAMDGWAVHSEDLQESGATLKITQRITAGERSSIPLLRGEAARIFTGATIPPGADAVVMQEHAKLIDDHHVAFHEKIKRGQWVRKLSLIHI